MHHEPTPIPQRRLRNVTEARLIERPLRVRRQVIRLPRRHPAGWKVWLAAALTVAAMFALPV